MEAAEAAAVEQKKPRQSQLYLLPHQSLEGFPGKGGHTHKLTFLLRFLASHCCQMVKISVI